MFSDIFGPPFSINKTIFMILWNIWHFILTNIAFHREGKQNQRKGVISSNSADYVG